MLYGKSGQEDAMVGDEPSVASPPEGFAAHGHGGLILRVCHQSFRGGAELPGAHVRSVGPEKIVAEGRVR